MIRKSILALAAIARSALPRSLRPPLRRGAMAGITTAGATASASTAASTARATSTFAPDCYYREAINRFGEVRLDQGLRVIRPNRFDLAPDPGLARGRVLRIAGFSCCMTLSETGPHFSG